MHTIPKIPTISNSAYTKKIQQRKYENISIMRSIDQFFRKKRGYVFRMPKPNTPVIMLVSGGLDSTITWGVLLKYYHLNVYPLFLNKGEKRTHKEETAVDYFSHYYSRVYPDLYRAPYKSTISLPQKELIHELNTPFSNLRDTNYKGNFDPNSTVNIFLGSPGIVPYYAMLYARYLEIVEGVTIRSIFSSVMAGDGTVCPSQTVTSLKLIMQGMCCFTGDYTWQFTSIAVEKALGTWLEKKDLIKIGAAMGLPLEKTWSCYNAHKYQCGICLACESRKNEFIAADVKDFSQYQNTLWYRQILSTTKTFIKKTYPNMYSVIKTVKDKIFTNSSD